MIRLLFKKLSIVLLVFFVFPFLSAPAHARIVINEMFPKTEFPDQQWIELFNTGSDVVSLDRWKIENASGNAFLMNASALISPLGFLVFPRTQTGITLSIQGDTVSLFDEKAALIDRVSYPGTLGYYTAYSRMPDGSLGWVICAPSPYFATPGQPNKCPIAPTPTNIPSNTLTPTPTRQPTPSQTSTPTITVTPMSSPTPSLVLTMTIASTPPLTSIEFIQNEEPRSYFLYISIALACIGISILILLTVLYKRRTTPQSPEEEQVQRSGDIES